MKMNKIKTSVSLPKLKRKNSFIVISPVSVKATIPKRLGQSKPQVDQPQSMAKKMPTNFIPMGVMLPIGCMTLNPMINKNMMPMCSHNKLRSCLASAFATTAIFSISFIFAHNKTAAER